MKKLIVGLGSPLIAILISATALLAQTRTITISGKITDSTGTVLPGVSVSLKSSTTGTTSDSNGSYKIAIPAAAVHPVLSFSFIGYKTEEAPARNRINIDIILSKIQTSLSEVIFIGYGNQAKRDLTTAVGLINAKTVESLPVYTAEQVLQGTVAGINVIQNSGSPGSPLTTKLSANYFLRSP